MKRCLEGLRGLGVVDCIEPRAWAHYELQCTVYDSSDLNVILAITIQRSKTTATIVFPGFYRVLKNAYEILNLMYAPICGKWNKKFFFPVRKKQVQASVSGFRDNIIEMLRSVFNLVHPRPLVVVVPVFGSFSPRF